MAVVEGPVPVGPDGAGQGVDRARAARVRPGRRSATPRPSTSCRATAASFTSDEPLTADGRWDVRADRRGAVHDPHRRAAADRSGPVRRHRGGRVAERVAVGSTPRRTGPTPTSASSASGSAWVGVSAQVVGIDGRDADDPGSFMALKVADPERYGAAGPPGRRLLLRHLPPGRRARPRPAPTRCSTDWCPSGCWPSASRSRRSGSAPTSTRWRRRRTRTTASWCTAGRRRRGAAQLGRRVNGLSTDELAPPMVGAPDPTLVRTDLDVPVLVVSAETDLVGEHLGYARARQPDTPDVPQLGGGRHRARRRLPARHRRRRRRLGRGRRRRCSPPCPTRPARSTSASSPATSPINAGPQTYVLRRRPARPRPVGPHRRAAAVDAPPRARRRRAPASGSTRSATPSAASARRRSTCRSPCSRGSARTASRSAACSARPARSTRPSWPVASAATRVRRAWCAATDAAVAAGVILRRRRAPEASGRRIHHRSLTGRAVTPPRQSGGMTYGPCSRRMKTTNIPSRSVGPTAGGRPSITSSGPSATRCRGGSATQLEELLARRPPISCG